MIGRDARIRQIESILECGQATHARPQRATVTSPVTFTPTAGCETSHSLIDAVFIGALNSRSKCTLSVLYKTRQIKAGVTYSAREGTSEFPVDDTQLQRIEGTH